MNDRHRLLRSFRIPALFVLALWLMKVYEIVTAADLSVLGNYPRKLYGLTGIFTSPLVHGDMNHLLTNSVPLLILGSLMIYFYPSASKRVIPAIYLFTGAAVWLLARPVYHIGASGLVYGLAFFLFFSGVFRNDMKSLVISFFIIFMYGGIVWGLLPYLMGVSWESHLSGAVAGSVLAWLFRYFDLPPKEPWMMMEEEPQPNISYRYIYVPKEKAKDDSSNENEEPDSSSSPPVL